MKKLIFLVLSVFCLAVTVQAADTELVLFNWSEYMDPEIIQNFEKDTGIKVREDLYESNEEMMAKLQAGGVSQYDIVVPSHYIMPVLIHTGLLMPLDHAQVPNLSNLKAMFREIKFDPGNKYSAPYLWGTVGLLYNKEKMPNYESTWAMVFDEKRESGPFLLIDDQRVSIGIALRYLGYSLNTTDKSELKQAAELLVKTKKKGQLPRFRRRCGRQKQGGGRNRGGGRGL